MDDVGREKEVGGFDYDLWVRKQEERLSSFAVRRNVTKYDVVSMRGDSSACVLRDGRGVPVGLLDVWMSRGRVGRNWQASVYVGENNREKGVGGELVNYAPALVERCLKRISNEGVSFSLNFVILPPEGSDSYTAIKRVLDRAGYEERSDMRDSSKKIYAKSFRFSGGSEKKPRNVSLKLPRSR
jgi:hypothetical protein